MEGEVASCLEPHLHAPHSHPLHCNGYFLSGLAEAQKATAPGCHCFLPKSKSSALAFSPQQLERKSSLSRALIFLLQGHGP